jgi:hypothetical protein
MKRILTPTLLVFLVTSCVVLPRDERTLVATSLPQPGPTYTFRVDLTKDTRAIEVEGLSDESPRFMPTIISAKLLKGDGAAMRVDEAGYLPVLPGKSVDLYRGDPSKLAQPLQIRVTGIDQRSMCEFKINLPSATGLSRPVRVYRLTSTAPM